MTAENRKVSVSEKGYGLALSGKESLSSWKKRLGLVLGGNASKALLSSLAMTLLHLLLRAVDVGSLIPQNEAGCALLYS